MARKNINLQTLKSTAPAALVGVDTDSQTAAGYRYTPAGVAAMVGLVRKTFDPARYGADPDGVVASDAAFAAAKNAAIAAGGHFCPTPGTYLLNSQWVIDCDGQFRDLMIDMHGVTLKAGAGLAAKAVLIKDTPWMPNKVFFRGCSFDHRGHATVRGAIRLEQASNARITDCTVLVMNPHAEYDGIEIAASTPGAIDTNSFWVRVAHNSFRVESGASSLARSCVRLVGNTNAAKIVDNQFTMATASVLMESDGVIGSLANAVIVTENDFETNGSTAIGVKVVGVPGDYWPTGLRVFDNRVESMWKFVQYIQSAAGAVSDPSMPLSLRDNYLVPSVTTYFDNPNGARYSSDERTISAIGGQANRLEYGSDLDFRVANGGWTRVGNASGNAAYNGGGLRVGASQFIYADAAGALRAYNWGSPPTAENDGYRLTPFVAFVDITGANTSAAIAFATERNTTFAIHMTAEVASGAPAVGSRNPYITNKTTTGATINLDAAPGVGNTVRIWYSINRNQLT